MKAALLCLVAPLILHDGRGAAAGAAYHAAVTADLDGDGIAETVEVDARREAILTVRHGGTILYQGLPRSWRPWKLATGRLEPGRPPRIIIGMFKSTRYFPRPHNCLFVYGWNKGILSKMWLGSSLDHPYVDFTLAPVWQEQTDQLIAVETLLNGSQCVAIYSWTGFGFGLDWQSPAWKAVRLLSANRRTLTIMAAGRHLVLRPIRKEVGL